MAVHRAGLTRTEAATRILLAVALVLGGGYVAWQWGGSGSVYTAAGVQPSPWTEPTPVTALDAPPTEDPSPGTPLPADAPDAGEANTAGRQIDGEPSAQAPPGEAPATVIAQAGDAVMRQIVADAEARGERRALAKIREEENGAEPTTAPEDDTSTNGKSEDVPITETQSPGAMPSCIPSSRPK